MAKGTGRNRRGTKKPKNEMATPHQSEVAALQLPGAPPPPARAEVATPQLPGASPRATQPEVDTPRRLPGDPAPPQAIPGAPAPRPLAPARRGHAIAAGPAAQPPQAEVVWFRRLLEELRVRFPGTAVARIAEVLQAAWASVRARWSDDDALLAAVECEEEELPGEVTPENRAVPTESGQAGLPPLLQNPPVHLQNTAWMYDDRYAAAADRKNKKSDRKNKKSDSPELPPPVIVDGETVPAEIVEIYKRYCRIAGTRSSTTTICHLCIFELELHPNGIVRTSNMIAHCSMHDTVAVRCGRFGCAAKVPPGCALRWHTHFCHDLPVNWWLPKKPAGTGK